MTTICDMFVCYRGYKGHKVQKGIKVKKAQRYRSNIYLKL